MTDISDWKIPKWPFLAANAALVAVAGGVVWKAAHPISLAEILVSTICVALGAVAGCLPFILEYRATKALVEVNALATVAGQLHYLKKYAAQVSAATDQWARVQEATQAGAGETVAAAKEIAARMAEEVRSFNEFQARLNDSEKGALRLDAEKLRRAEGEWLQVVARILDHVFALHNAAARTGQPELAEQVGQFQNACRDAARRVGLTPFAAAPGEGFDAQKHRAHGVENPPDGSVVGETLAPGLTFQSRLVRHALVRLQAAEAPASAVKAEAEAEAGNPGRA